MKQRIIAFANQKGGTGKSTCTINLGACFALKGYKTLIIDMDPQANASMGLGIETYKLKKSMFNVLSEENSLSEIIMATGISNLVIAPSHITLSGIEAELLHGPLGELRLKSCMEDIEGNDYNFILIDCPPTLGMLTTNALIATNEVMIPIQMQLWALEGVAQLIGLVDKIQRLANRELYISGVIATMYDSGTNLSKTVLSEVKKRFGDKVFNTYIRKNVTIAESNLEGKPVVVYNSGSTGAIDYKNLTKGILNND